MPKYRDVITKQATIDLLFSMQKKALKNSSNTCVARLLGHKSRALKCPYSSEKECYDCLAKLLNEEVNNEHNSC